MIFFFNANGDLLNSVIENVYQGSNGANTIYFVGPFPETNEVSVRYHLPNGEDTGETRLTKTDKPLLQAQTELGKDYNVWITSLNKVATAYSGMVIAQFDVISPKQVVSTKSITFPVIKGVAPTKPLDKSTEHTLQEILAILSEFNETSKELDDKLNNKVDYEKLDDFYTKEETNQFLSEKADISFVNASKEELVELINTLRSNKFVVVETLPEPSAETYGKIYLVPIENGEDGNYHDEYITVSKEDGSFVWEYLGSTKVDLSDYAKKEYVTEEIEKALQDIPSGGSSVEIDPTLTQEGKAADAKATGEALGGKLDKYTSQPGNYRVYGVDADGKTQVMFNTNASNYDGFIPRWVIKSSSVGNSDKGSVLITSDPTKLYHAANKNYVDEQIANNKPTLYKRTLTISSDGWFVKITGFSSTNEYIEYTATEDYVSYLNKYYSGINTTMQNTANSDENFNGVIDRFFAEDLSGVGEYYIVGFLINGQTFANEGTYTETITEV